MLDEIKENEVPKVPKNQEHQQIPQTPANVRRSTRLSRPPERFSPSLYYVSFSGLIQIVYRIFI